MSRKKSEYVKCRYSHCKHEERELPRAEAVCCGNAYYHSDCYSEVNNIKECIDIYVNHFEAEPIFEHLKRVINKIIYEKGYDSDYLLYAMKYAASHRIPIRHPPGLYYLMKNDEIKSLWEKDKLSRKRKTVVVENKDTSFSYVPKKEKGFASIIGG